MIGQDIDMGSDGDDKETSVNFEKAPEKQRSIDEDEPKTTASQKQKKKGKDKKKKQQEQKNEEEDIDALLAEIEGTSQQKGEKKKSKQKFDEEDLTKVSIGERECTVKPVLRGHSGHIFMADEMGWSFKTR